jgi:hypothetical protein
MALQQQRKFPDPIDVDWSKPAQPLFDSDESPDPRPTTWDFEGAFPRRDYIELWFASDLVSHTPVQKKFEFWFSYIAKEDHSGMFSKLPGRRFKLIGIYGKGDSPNPEEITPNTANKTIHHINNYYRRAFRACLREAIADKLGATFKEISQLNDVVNRHTIHSAIGIDYDDSE